MNTTTATATASVTAADAARVELSRRASNRDEKKAAAAAGRKPRYIKAESDAVFGMSKADLEALLAAAPATESVDVTVVVTRPGDYVAHAAGCKDTRKRTHQDTFEPVPCATRYEAVCSVYDNGIMDEAEEDRDDVAYWEGALDFAPCLGHLPSAV